jgi:hypothetical protein
VDEGKPRSTRRTRIKEPKKNRFVIDLETVSKGAEGLFFLPMCIAGFLSFFVDFVGFVVSPLQKAVCSSALLPAVLA